MEKHDPEALIQKHRRLVADRFLAQYNLMTLSHDHVGRFLVLEVGVHENKLAVTTHEDRTALHLWVSGEHNPREWEISKVVDLNYNKVVPFKVRPCLDVEHYEQDFEDIPV